MPTALSHPAVPIAARLALGRDAISARLLLVAICCSALPDADAIGFWLGVPYENPLGHRGFTHSLTFAALLAVAAVPFARALRSRRLTTFAVVFISTASHGLLDAFTNGGLGVGFFIPFSNHRTFAPWRPIVVSPISVTRFVGERALAVLTSELFFVWLPLLSLAVCCRVVRHWRRVTRNTPP